MISVAIPTHQDRVKYWIHTVRALYDVVDEYIIVDDGSVPGIQKKIRDAVEGMHKVTFIAGVNRQGPFRNKYLAMMACRHEWVALLDSDNKFSSNFIETFLLTLRRNDTAPAGINCPIKAAPRFDFSKFKGRIFMNGCMGAGGTFDDDLFFVLMNTGNYIVNRINYLNILKPVYESNEPIPFCCDVIAANYYLLKGGMTMRVVDGMRYSHLDHEGSVYREYVTKEPEETLKWQNRVRELR
jgi:glycosyltransferase involved in cell wall biosynthesis